MRGPSSVRTVVCRERVEKAIQTRKKCLRVIFRTFTSTATISTSLATGESACAMDGHALACMFCDEVSLPASQKLSIFTRKIPLVEAASSMSSPLCTQMTVNETRLGMRGQKNTTDCRSLQYYSRCSTAGRPLGRLLGACHSVTDGE